jgi:uncharacterized protein
MKLLVTTILILILISAPVYGDDFQDGLDAYKNQDMETAREKFSPLAKKGDAVAQYYLGTMYSFSSTERMKWLTLSANQGYAKAMVRLAWHHQIDNCEEALKWMNLATKQDSGDAYDELGVWYIHGTCVPQNYNEGIRLYHLAAEKGVSNAQGNLGMLYLSGNGVPQDYVLAHMWFNIANATQIKSRESFLPNYVMLRRKVEKLMTPSQIEKAQEMARGWMEEHK